MQTIDQVVDEVRDELHRFAREPATRTAMAQNGRLKEFLEGRRQRYEHLVDYEVVIKRIQAENALRPDI
jgi:uncharacterized protein (DUF488 family)